MPAWHDSRMPYAPDVPTLKTQRLLLRGWREDDVAAYAAMMAHADTARFITGRGLPLSPSQCWTEVAFFIGHWALRGHGMFVVEEQESGRFVGRIGPLAPEGWPDLEIAWALTAEAQGKGYAVEAASAAIRWAFATFDIPRVISIIHPDNIASQKVAQRLGERRTAERFTPFREQCDIWELRRECWSGD
jgi:RimJ/RimL family protein N-acetyltransferase